MLDALLSVCKRKAVHLEQLLQGVFIYPAPDFSYVLTNGERVHVQPEYLLGGFDQRHVFHGLLPVAEKEGFVKVLLGFRTHHDGQENYYFPKEGGWVLQPLKNKHVLYLPVAETNFKQYLSVCKDGQWAPLENSPFPIYGLKKASGPSYPFAMVFSGSKGEPPAFFGLYRHPQEEKLAFYRMNESGDALEELLEALDKSTARALPALPPPADEKADQKKSPLQLDPLIIEEKIEWNNPQKIVDYLDRFVVGQEDAKKKMAIAFSVYMKRVTARMPDVPLPKGHVLLIGPTGVGKTLLSELLVEKAELPKASTSTTDKSGPGYVGESLASVFATLATQVKDEAPFGVIFIDEIDKVVGGTDYELFGKKQQDQLIGWLGGTFVQPEQHPARQQEVKRLHTRNLLFITAGAFAGNGQKWLAKIIARRLGMSANSIAGFGREGARTITNEGLLHAVTPADLIAYGLMPELVRRLPHIGLLDPLTVSDKVTILKEKENSAIKHYQNLFALEGYTLVLDELVYELLAKQSPPEIGASGLETACQQLFQEIIFNTKEYADGAQVIRITPELAEKLLEKK